MLSVQFNSHMQFKTAHGIKQLYLKTCPQSVRHKRLIELMVVQANDAVTQPSRSRLVHHALLPPVDTEGLLGVPGVACSNSKKHSFRPVSKYGTKVGVTTCTASVSWDRLVLQKVGAVLLQRVHGCSATQTCIIAGVACTIRLLAPTHFSILLFFTAVSH